MANLSARTVTVSHLVVYSAILHDQLPIVDHCRQGTLTATLRFIVLGSIPHMSAIGPELMATAAGEQKLMEMMKIYHDPEKPFRIEDIEAWHQKKQAEEVRRKEEAEKYRGCFEITMAESMARLRLEEEDRHREERLRRQLEQASNEKERQAFEELLAKEREKKVFEFQPNLVERGLHDSPRFP